MAELEAREAAAHARAEALRARIAELTEQLAGEEELCSRLGITRQTVLEILGGGDDRGSGALEGAEVGPGGVELDGDAAVGAALRVDGPVARAGLEGAPAAARGGAAVEAQAPGQAWLAGRAGSGPVCPPHPTGRVRIDRPRRIDRWPAFIGGQRLAVALAASTPPNRNERSADAILRRRRRHRSVRCLPLGVRCPGRGAGRRTSRQAGSRRAGGPAGDAGSGAAAAAVPGPP